MSADGIVWDGDVAPAAGAPTLKRPGAVIAAPAASGIQWDSQAAVTPSTAPTLQNPQGRSLLRTAGDIGTSLGQGVESAGMFVPQLANTLTGGAVDKYAFKPVTGAVDSLLGGPGQGRTLAEASQDTRTSLNTLKSPYLQQQDQELADTKGFLPTAKKILTTPSLLVEQAAEQVPQLVAPGGIVRKAGAVAFERAAGSALARGVEKRVAAGMTEEAATKAATAAAERLGQRAAIKAGTKAAIGTEAAMSGSQNSEQAQQQVLGLDQKVLDANPDYQSMVARGVTPQDAREALAQQAGIRAGAAGAAITAATGGITGKLESKIFQGETGVHGVGQLLTGTGAKELAKAVGKETVQEGLQEGGEQFGQNVGVQSVDPNQSLMDQVPENAALGAVLGGTIGAGTFAGSAALSRPHQANVPNPDAAPGSLSDAANVLATPSGPLGRVAEAAQVGGMRPNDAAAQAAGAPPLPAETPPASVAETAQPPAAAAPAAAPTPAPAPTTVPLPWVNPQTGEVGTPTKGQLTIALADYIAQTFQTAGHMRINAGDVADAWGVPKAEINRARNGATQLATRKIKTGEAATPAETGNPVSEQDQASAASSDMGNPISAPGQESDTTASVPFMIPNAMKAELRALGHTDADISAMTPAQAHATLKAGESVLGGTRDLLGHSQPAAEAAINQAATDAKTTADTEAAAEAKPVAPADVPTEPAVAQKEPSSAEKPDSVPIQPEAPGHSLDRPVGRDSGAGQGGAEGGAPAPVSGEEPTQEAAAPRARVPAAETVEPAPAVATPHKVSAAARDAEGLRVKTPTGETNGRSHVDGLIRDGFTKVESHNNGKTMQHTMVNAAGERAPIKVRQLKYAQEASTRHAETARKQIDVAAHEAATSPHNDTPEPTLPQIEAGNYKKGHIDVHGLDISIENPRGSTRSGVGENGKPWSHVMSDHYGYVRGTVGADGDHVDTYVGQHPESKRAYVIDQIDQKTGAFDEHKVMLGFRSKGDAVRAYRSNFDPGWKVGPVKDMTVDQFKGWLKNGDTTRSVATVPIAAAPAKPGAPIEDLGEKIGGARKDTAKPLGTRGGKIAADERPAWAKRYVPMQDVKSGKWNIIDTRTGRATRVGYNLASFPTLEEAQAAVPLLALAQNHRVVPVSDGTFAIKRDVTDRKRVTLKGGFDTHEAAMTYMVKHAGELLAQKTSFGEEVLVKPDRVIREGAPRRAGDVDGQTFMDTFGFRGVEFGKWNNQAERQEVMNHAYDGLHDLAEVISVPAKALSLNGEIGLAFGARGQGLSGARAHYEPNYAVMNLTKMQGAGALAHEWFHALDHYLARVDGKASSERVTNKRGDTVLKTGNTPSELFLSHSHLKASNARPELLAAYNGLIDTMFRKAEQYVQDTAQAEQFVGRARDAVTSGLDDIRRNLASTLTYGSRTKPASTEQLAEFDKITEPLRNGQGLETEYRPAEGKVRQGALGRRTNDVLEGINALMKAVRNRQGFNAEGKGTLDRLRQEMSHYATRIQMLDDARGNGEKTKQVPTRFAMNAKEIDQGRASDYWTTRHEMAARAFSAYIEDKLASEGHTSDFLSYGSDNKFYRLEGIRPFPEGEERQVIDKAFDHLFDTMKAEEGADGRVRLFSLDKAASDEPFYSALTRSVDSAKGAPKAADAAAWKQWMDGAQRRGEFKQAEREWLGVDQWLTEQKGPVTREQLQEFVRDNQVQVKETTLGESAQKSPKALVERAMAVFDATYTDADSEHRADAEAIAKEWVNGDIPIRDAANGMGVSRDALGRIKVEEDKATKFSQYQLPGGANYKELLLTLPNEVTERIPQTPNDDLDNFKLDTAVKRQRPADYRSGHFDQRNILAHVRFNERTDADGKKVLFLEEVQSDWHQAGRKQGYVSKDGRPSLPDGWKVEAPNAKHADWRMLAYDDTEQFSAPTEDALWSEASPHILKVATGIPDAPLKKEWPMLAIKRMVRYAAENGFDRIAWTTGEQQAARYDLSKQVKEIIYHKGDDGSTHTMLEAYRPDGGELFRKKVPNAEVADVVGKEVADKIQQGERSGKLSGIDLKVGGEGMQAFYDRMLPNEVNKWAKPFGAKVGDTRIATERSGGRRVDDGAGGVISVDGELQTPSVHSLDITPAMREAALGGLPLFRHNNDQATTTAKSTPEQEAHTAKIKQIASAAMGKWKGDDVPALRVVETPEQLPEMAKRAANGLPSDAYKTAKGMYDGRTIYIVASAHRTDQAGIRSILTTMAHEGVGHYGMERIVTRELGAEAWTKIETATERLRADPKLASPAIREVLASVERRYQGADAPTFAREFLAVSAERGVRNGLLDRVVTAIRQWLRKVFPDLKLSEHELRQLLVHSDQYLSRGQSYQQRVQAVAAMSFSRSVDAGLDTPAFKRWFGDSKVVDSEGNPLVVYHVTNAPKFNVFNRAFASDAQGAKLGHFFTTDQTFAERYAKGGNGRRYEQVYLAIKNPVMIPDLSIYQRAEQMEKQLAEWRSAGFDGAVVNAGDGEKTWVAFDSEQIKSATGNNGDFSPVDSRINFSRAEPTDTPQFKRWFGNSAVVDAAGEPLPVYHGTADDFDAFDPKRSGSATAHMTANLGTFFAEDRAKAQHYAENASGGVPAEERVVDAYLSIQKPYEMGLNQFMDLDSQEESEALRNKLIGQGYDGIHIKGANQWIAFTPTQIKSASENRGTFDPGNTNIYFSRDENADPDNPKPARRSFTDAAASIEAIHDTLPQLDRSAFQQVKDWISGKARDLEPMALGALQLRHVLELASEDPTLKAPAQLYANTYQRMDGDRNTLTIDGAAKVDALVKWARQPGLAGWMGKVSEDAKRLFHFMHAVTQLAVDPTNQYERLLMRDAGNEYKPWTKELIKQRVKILREVALTRSGDDKTRIYDEIKDLQRLPQREKVREQKYPELVRQWNALTPEAKKQFQVMRDHYREQSEALEEATLAHIASLDIPEQNRRAAAALVNRNFAEAKVDGVYFPLSRFGDYWISATTKDGEYVFAKYESANQMQQAEKRFLASGAHIEARGRQDNNYKAKDAPSGTFIGDLMGVLKNAPDKVKDEIYQMYLKALPNLSLRKHGIHRKNIAGYTDDVPRAFAGSVFHGAHQISKARYGWQLTNTLEQMRERMESRRTVVSGTEAAHADALIGEINRRHDWILNPTNNALSNKLTGVAFTYFLGASPASAIVNLIQVPQIVLPVLGAQHGWGRATAVLGRAMKQAIGTGGHIDKVLTGEELDAYRALEKQGTFQRSATHALAGISEGDNLRSSPAYTKVMNAVSWMFHTSEVINREATGMAAFRLAREKGQKFEEALKYADQITNGTHGDYSNANRARYMQGNVQKVVLQFKNYSLAMSWLWGRNFYNAFKGEDAATRTLARRTLTGMLGMTGLFAGVIGMPIFNLLRYGAQAVHAASGDDDEPWDFVTEFRSWLAEHLGETAASVIADGAASQLGANVASRVSMSDLWFRDADKQLEGEDAYNNMLQSIAGPLGGLLKNLYVGAQQFSDGHTERGIETMLPTFAKNAVKATRFASQGVNTLRGDPIVSDVSAPQAMIQAMGFQPTKVADQQRLNNALYNYQKFIQDRRQELMNAFAMAQQAGDDDGRAATLAKIQSFNQKYPEIAIRMSNLHASLRQRARFSAEADNGIRLNKKLANRVRDEVGASAQQSE